MAGRRSISSLRTAGGVLGWFGVRPRPGQGLRLESGRIYLRRPRDSDFEAWTSLRAGSREFLAPWEPTWSKAALSRAAFRRRLHQYAEDWRDASGYNFLIFRAEDDALLGAINLSNVRRGIVQAGTLGYWMGASFTGQGYMTEALQCMLRYAFDRLELHRVEAACLPHNTASEALLRKGGFRLEGHARKYLRIDGKWQDHLIFAILREDRAGASPGPA
jgi:ribosomal-protein-alanine N-acetyltransferase